MAMMLRLAPWLVADESHLAEIAQAIVNASDSPEDVAALVSVGWWESGRSWDCERRGDHGQSVSCWQLRVCVREDFRCVMAKSDLTYATSLALSMLRASEKRCKRVEGANLWSEYTTGRCIPNRESRIREATAAKLLRDVSRTGSETTLERDSGDSSRSFTFRDRTIKLGGGYADATAARYARFQPWGSLAERRDRADASPWISCAFATRNDRARWLDFGSGVCS